MSRLLATLRLDVQLQARHSLYAIGVAVAVLMGLGGRFLFPAESLPLVVPGFLLVGLGGTTYMFGASTMLLEKGENILAALRVTPLTTRDYVASKAITLTGFALVESAITYGIAAGARPVNVGLLVLGVVVLGVFYTMLGLGQVAGHDSVTSFLIPDALVVTMILQLPMFLLMGVGPDALWYAIPTTAPLLLMCAAFEPMPWTDWAYAIAMSAAMLAGGGWFVARRFRRLVRLQEV